MRRLKTQAAKDSLLQRVRKQRLKYVTVLPSLITILNGICGFAAIVLASQGAFAMAGYIILLAMIADTLDGRLARISQSTSSFGGQLDSLCDVISFGVAPAFLVLTVLDHKLTELSEFNFVIRNFLQRSIWLTVAVYISCTAIRLARFNVENEDDETAHMSFIGLPAPAAAGVLVSLIIFHQETLLQLLQTSKNIGMYVACENIIMVSLPFLALAVSVLMVSRIQYPHIVNQYIKGKKPFAHLIRAILALGLIIWSRQAALVLIFFGFAASGFAKRVYYKIHKGDSALQYTHRLESES